MREIAMLERWDRHRKIRFTDINHPSFQATGIGKTQQELMERIHARLPDGTWLDGVEVFRRLYAAVGFERLAAFSRWPLVSHAMELVYRWFARNRLRLTGRCQNDSCVCKGKVPDLRQ
jgi:predicted DCC family thiol-disulfide oxidoreductase YuxK